jgi:hypothetical protein
MICWGNGDTHEEQECVKTYDFGDGRVIRITHLHLIRRDYMGLFKGSSDTGLRYVDMTGFPCEEEREFRALRDANDAAGMKSFIEARWPKN